LEHTYEELLQEFEKFVIMVMKPGADLVSLPFLDNPDNLVVHAYAAFIWELLYIAINTVAAPIFDELLYSLFLKSNACSSFICFFIYFVSQIASLP